MNHKTSLRAETTATIEEIQAWSSVVLKDKLTLEYAAVDIETKRILYHLHLELEHPVPEPYLAKAEFLTLTWPVGGIWKIMNLSHNNQHVHCMSWRSTEMDNEEVNEVVKKVTPDWVSLHRAQSYNLAQAAVDFDELPPTIFNWKMQLGTWGHNQHWFIREVMPPQNSRPGPLTAYLMAGFAPLEVQIEVNNLISVDTVAQTFTADVMWEVTLPGITTIREDSALQELMQILEIDGDEFEFTNVNSTQDEGKVYYCLSPAGPVRFTDPTSFAESTTESPSHMQISRRIVATFSEEMTVYSFPVDQQKLTFSFSTGYGVRESLRITPAPVDAGTFAIANYKMGNVYDVVYHDKVFVGEIDAEGVKKGIRFELMLERRPGYYVTNVAIPAGIITYLCFISYTTLSDGTLIATGDRLQIVLTLLLTAVTFKNQAASLTPQISYFTTLDKYVFFCFIIACVVVIENALFPVVASYFSKEKSWHEKSLLWFSISFFTLVNVAWGIHAVIFVKTRKRASKVLLQVHEVIRVIGTSTIPDEHREAVLHEYLDECHFQDWELPKICCAEFGYLHVQLPDDEPQKTTNVDKKQKLHISTRQKAEQKFDALKGIYTKLNPTGAPLRAFSQESQMPLRAAKPSETFQGGRNHVLRRTIATPTSPALNNSIILKTPASAQASSQSIKCTYHGAFNDLSESLRRCGSCKRVGYYSREHQRQHWKTHRAECTYQSKQQEPEKPSSSRDMVVVVEIKSGEGSGLTNRMVNHVFSSRVQATRYIRQRLGYSQTEEMKELTAMPFLHELMGFSTGVLYVDPRQNAFPPFNEEFIRQFGFGFGIDELNDMLNCRGISGELNAMAIYLGSKLGNGLSMSVNASGDAFFIGTTAKGEPVTSNVLWGAANFVYEAMDY